MKPLNRITPEDVEAAYRKHGLKPIAAHLMTIKGCCCAVGALFYPEIKSAGGYCYIDYPAIDEALACSDEERMAFENGFDSGFKLQKMLPVGSDTDQLYRAGWKVGQHMRELADSGKI